jgi:hypothetical protein
MARYLRFAAAGFFALLTLALIGLWVRSYWAFDWALFPLGANHSAIAGIYSGMGGLQINSFSVDEWRAFSTPIDAARDDPYAWPNLANSGFTYLPENRICLFPLVVPALFAAALAALFAFKRTWRFTIRTLLIATTVVAAVMGIGVYLL